MDVSSEDEEDSIDHERDGSDACAADEFLDNYCEDVKVAGPPALQLQPIGPATPAEVWLDCEHSIARVGQAVGEE